MDLFGIGDFSRMSGLPVKTLRFYHEKELLIPAQVEAESGYRQYDHWNLETARVIVALRRLDFGLDTISAILASRQDDGDILEYLETQKASLQDEITHRRDIVQTLDSIIAQETQARAIMTTNDHEIEEKRLDGMLIGGIRTEGRYSDCGKIYSQLSRKLGRYISGKAMMLCHDEEYREEDADHEPCMPLKKRVEAEGVEVRELPGGRAICLLHRGPYEQLSRAYGRLLEHAKATGLGLQGPSREVYLKVPGMIFKGNPAKCLTEVQFLVEESG